MIDKEELLNKAPDPGKSIYCRHDTCERDRPDHKRRLWVSHEGDVIIGYCHNCGSKASVKTGRKKQEVKKEVKVDKVSKLPEDFTTDIPMKHRVWFYKYDILDDLIVKYKLGWSEGLQRIILPIYKDNECIGWQGRSVSSKVQPKYKTYLGVKKALFFSQMDSVTNSIVITEDMLSAIKVGEIHKSCALLGTHLSEQNAVELIKNYKTIVIWLDGDHAGLKGAHKLRKKLSTLANTVRIVHTKVDPKEFSFDRIKTVLIGE